MTNDEVIEHYLRFGQFEQRTVNMIVVQESPINKFRQSICTVFLKNKKDSAICAGFLYNNKDGYIY